VEALNCDPWHGHTRRSADRANPTVQPAWGQIALNATNCPDDGWSTMEGVPLIGSVKLAAPPIGTSCAGPIARPGGVVGGAVVVVCGVVDGVVDGVLDGVVDVDVEGGVVLG
jgi:hypothetical protein